MLRLIKKHSDIILLFFLGILIFSFIVHFAKTDIRVHIKQAITINISETHSYPANFLYYFVVNLLSGFSSNKFLMYKITIILLSIAIVAKYSISKNIIKLTLGKERVKLYGSKISFIAIGVFFCFAIPDPFSFFYLNKMYIVKVVPQVWHNTTIILLFPFAILLFWQQLLIFDPLHKTTIRDIIIASVLVLLNIFIKPSFIFVYAPVTAFFLLYGYRNESLKFFILKLIPIFIAGIVVLGQYYLIYKLQMGSIQKASSSVVISSPFEIFAYFMPFWFIPISLFISYIFPIFSVIMFKEIIKYRPFVYALCLTIAGIILSAFVMESGPRKYHGNFLWQNIICSYLLLLSTVLFLTPKFLNKNLSTNKMRILICLFFFQVISGILYLFRIGFTFEYL